MRLRTILFLLFLVLAFVPLSVLWLFSSSYYHDKIVKLLENDLSVATLMQVETIQNFLEERNAAISIVARHGMVQELLSPEKDTDGTELAVKQGYVTRMLEARVEENKYLVSAAVMDRQRRVLAGDSGIEDTMGRLEELEPPEEDFFDGALHYTPVIESDTDAGTSRVIMVIKGIYVKDELAGYFVEEMNLSFFEKVRVAINLFNNGTIYLVDGRRGVITAGSALDSRQEFVTTPDERKDYNRAWEQRDKLADHGLLRYSILGQHYISYYASIENADWMIISSVNTDQALQGPLDSLRLFLFAFLLLLTACVIVNYLLTSRITKPLDNIVEKFGRIRKTQDYGIRMDEVKGPELEVIATEINFLLANMEERMKKEKEKQNQLHEAASTDALTGLYNKRAMKEMMRKEMTKLKQQKKPLVLVYLDVDDFKSYNTKYGHGGGDKALAFVARSIRRLSRLGCRIGGDEFAFCITDERQIERLDETLETFMSALRRGTDIDGTGVRVPIHSSVGAAVWSGEEGFEELLERADFSMYEVKNRLKNGFQIDNTGKNG